MVSATPTSMVPLLAFWGSPSGRVLTVSVAVVLAVVAVVLAVPAPTARFRRLSRLALAARAPRLGETQGRPVGSDREAGVPWEVLRGVGDVLRARPDAWGRSRRAVAGLLVGSGVTGLCVVGGLRAGPTSVLIGLVGGLVCFVVVGRLEPGAVRQRRLRMVIDLPHTLELLAVALQAGLPLRAAVVRVGPLVGGPLAEDLAQVVRHIDLGVPEPDAWRRLRGHPTLGHLALDLARSVDSGTMLAATLRHHAHESRRNRRGALEARARSVGVHSVPPLMVCFLPAFLLIGVVPTGVTAFLHSLG